MRTLLKIVMDTTAGNNAITDGSLPQTINSIVEMTKPEASYFCATNGKRSAYIFFDLKNSAQIPQIAEICFTKFNAEVEFIPVMNQDDLKQGLQAVMASQKNK